MAKRIAVALGCAFLLTLAFAQDASFWPAGQSVQNAELTAPTTKRLPGTPDATSNTPLPGQRPGEQFSQRALRAGLESPAPTTPALQGGHAPAAPNSFSNFIAEALGRPLPLYGISLFQQPPSTFAPNEAGAVTPEYQIGPGDELIVRVWGPIEIDAAVTVDRSGSIVLPKAGEFRVAGVQYRDLTSHLKTALSRVYRNFDLSVTLGRLMPLTVYVVGEARQPGRFSMSSQSTLINAIFAVGGPSEQGSLRSVKLKRGDHVVADLDVYRFIANGDRTGDVRLAAGDMIVFEKVGPLVAVSGSVKRPAIYELKSATLSVAEALELAGGLTNTATDVWASLERIEARKARKVEDLTLQGDDLKVSLRDGDLLKVFPIKSKFENAITVRGNVAASSRHPWRPGIRLSDLIPNKDSLIVPDYWKAQNNLIFSESKNGEGIKRNLPEINWSYAVIERIGPDLRPKLIPFNLQRAIVGRDADHDLELIQGDTITIFSKDDIAVPQKERTVYVTLSGELKVPGVYQLNPGETLRQAIERAGGITEHAYVLGTSLQRESVRQEQQRRIDEIMARIEFDLRAANAEIAGKAVGSEGQAFMRRQITFQENSLKAIRGTAVSGRLYLGLPRRIDLTGADLPEIPLEDGDRIHLPNMLNIVNVFGAVGFQNTQLYAPSRSVISYIEAAGGLTNRAESDDVIVLSVDGAAHKRERSWLAPRAWGGDVTVMPGDSIFVPEKVDAVPLVAHLKDWTQVLYQMGLGAAAVKTLRD